MGVYARPDLLERRFKETGARMQGVLFQFTSVDKPLFAELKELAARDLKPSKSCPACNEPKMA